MAIKKPVVVRTDGAFESLADNDTVAVTISNTIGNMVTLVDDGLLVKAETPLEVQATFNVASISNTGEVTTQLTLPSEFKVLDGRRLMFCVEYSPTTVPPAGNGLIATLTLPKEAGGTYDTKVLFGAIPAKRAKIIVGYAFGKVWNNPSITISGATSTPIVASNVTVTVTTVPDAKVLQYSAGA